MVNQKKQASRQAFLEAIVEARQSLMKILYAYDDIDSDDNGTTSDNYPFNGSFEEWIFDYCHWVEELEDKWENMFSPSITVGELINLVGHLPHETQFTIATKDDYINIVDISLPDDEMFTTVVLHQGCMFSPTQV